MAGKRAEKKESECTRKTEEPVQRESVGKTEESMYRKVRIR